MFENLVCKKNRGWNSYFVIIFILGVISTSNAFAVPTVSIQMDKTTYSYGEKLFYTIEVSEVTGDIATIYIRDQQGKGSSGIPIAISEPSTPVPSLYPFEKEIFPEGKYFIEVEYSGASDSVEFKLVDAGNIVIPFWIKQVAYYWVTEQISDDTYADAIEFLIENKIIVVPTTENESTSSVTEIPTWVKKSTEWWLKDEITDTTYALGIQYLIKVGIIVV